ncbi:MAG: hypothetical protein KBC15_02395 [Candidatus Levybacteria bacterium]|nr:hypothetical protein [Candidatus Levybacteria bacterium]
MSKVSERLEILVETIPTVEADKRPLMVRVAQALCDEGFGAKEVCEAMTSPKNWADAMSTNIMGVHTVLIDGFQMGWIPAPGGVFGRLDDYDIDEATDDTLSSEEFVHELLEANWPLSEAYNHSY